jgi:hypothetical protein
MRTIMLVTRANRFTPPLRLGAMAAGLALLATAPLAAQASSGAGTDASTQKIQQEMREVGQKVIQLRQQALQDSVIQEEQFTLQQEIEQKMNDIDSATSTRNDRMNQIKQSFQQARQNQDTAKIRSLMTEYQTLGQKNQQTQMQAMQDKAIAADLDTFRTDLIKKMNDIDPSADSLISRLEALQATLQGGASGGSGQGG